MKYLASLAVCLSLSTFLLAKDAPPPSKTAAAMTAAAQNFVASLSDAEAAKTILKFDDPRRLDWHNIPKPERKGFQYKEMSAKQKELCLALLRTSLSETGYDKATIILSLEKNLHVGEKGKGPLRDPERYFLTFFGKPGDAGEWGYSFEGHHFSQNFVVRDGRVIADTPSFWGANPATVKTFVEGGPKVGTRTLAQEEQLGFDLVNSLDDAQKAKAIIDKMAPADYRGPGAPTPPAGPPAGIAAKDLNDAQKKLLVSLLETYSGNLAPELAEARLAEIKSAGIDRVYFAWAGGLKSGEPHYYRIQGPTFTLELVNIQSDPEGNPANHIHSVWRSLVHDFGLASK